MLNFALLLGWEGDIFVAVATGDDCFASDFDWGDASLLLVGDCLDRVGGGEPSNHFAFDDGGVDWGWVDTRDDPTFFGGFADDRFDGGFTRVNLATSKTDFARLSAISRTGRSGKPVLGFDYCEDREEK